MIISPPLLKPRTARETDAAWIERVMAGDALREFPVNTAGSWHGGIHISHTDSTHAESVRAIADGTVVSFRQPSGDTARDQPPLNRRAPETERGTDDGYVLLRHETEIGSGEQAKVIFWSLYMHLKSLRSSVMTGARIYRKEALGTSGIVDGVNAFHFQIFCDDAGMEKLAGRTTRELDVSKNGRTDAVYGDIHFYLPAGTKFYRHAPENNVPTVTGLTEVHSSGLPLYVSMTLEKGNCTMVTRQQVSGAEGMFSTVGEPLINADGEDYEYNLYKKAMKLYKQSPSAGFELLRFGRVVNTEHETLVPANAPLWRTVNFPGGKGVVNLADAKITKFSDADFPHWTGWMPVDDDTDTNSQCNSAIIKKWQEEGLFDRLKSRLICHFPLEWEKSTTDARFSWLKAGSDEHNPMSDGDYNRFKAHSEALCFDTGALGNGRLWHFNPAEFIRHFRKCGWLELDLVEKIMTSGLNPARRSERIKIAKIKAASEANFIDLNYAMRKYNLINPVRQSHFLGQGAVESDSLTSMQESSQVQSVVNGVRVGREIILDSTLNESRELGHWYGALPSERDPYFSGVKYNSSGGRITGSYSWLNGNCGDIDAQKYRGRGVKQLTGRDKYAYYWVYRGWLGSDSFDPYWWDDPQYQRRNVAGMTKRPAIVDDPHRVTENPYNCMDSGAWFIVCFRKRTLKQIDRDEGYTGQRLNNLVRNVSTAINGGDIGLPGRQLMTANAKRILCDDI